MCGRDWSSDVCSSDLCRKFGQFWKQLGPTLVTFGSQIDSRTLLTESSKSRTSRQCSHITCFAARHGSAPLTRRSKQMNFCETTFFHSGSSTIMSSRSPYLTLYIFCEPVAWTPYVMRFDWNLRRRLARAAPSGSDSSDRSSKKAKRISGPQQRRHAASHARDGGACRSAKACSRSEERRVGKECRSRRSPDH